MLKLLNPHARTTCQLSLKHLYPNAPRLASMATTTAAMNPTDSSKNTLQIGNTAKRDELITIEERYQKQWQEDKVFEADAPSTWEVPTESMTPEEIHKEYPKYYATAAYP